MSETVQRGILEDLYFEENPFQSLYVVSSKIEKENPEGWSDELVCRCYTAYSVEVCIPANPPVVYVGIFDDIYKNLEGVTLLLRKSHACNALCREEICLEESTEDLFWTRFGFKLKECKKPVFIKDDRCDCVWFGFSNGHVVIHFEKPRF